MYEVSVHADQHVEGTCLLSKFLDQCVPGSDRAVLAFSLPFYSPTVAYIQSLEDPLTTECIQVPS